MMMTSLTTRLKGRRILGLTSLLPTAAIAASLLSTLLAATLVVAQLANEDQRKSDLLRLRTALLDVVEDAGAGLDFAVKASVAGLAAGVGAEPGERLTRIRTAGGFSFTASVALSGRIITAIEKGPEKNGTFEIEPEPTTLGSAAQEAVLAWARQQAKPAQAILLTQEEPALVQVSFASAPEFERLVTVQSLDQSALRRLQFAAGLSDLSLRRPPKTAAMPLLLLLPEPALASFTWHPLRPGDALLDRILPLITGGLILLSALGLFASIRLKRTLLHVAESQRFAEHLAAHDTLTGLPNRMLFIEQLHQELERVQRGANGLSVLFLDLDGFKMINDSFGHAVGDQLLVECGERMKATIRGCDMLARLGGDEFAIIQTGITIPHEAAILAQRLIDEVKMPFAIEGLQVHVGVSVGIALAPDNGVKVDDLMRLADIAMYRAKQGGRGRLAFFEPQMDETLRMRKVVEDDLRHAIETDQLRLVYQPQVSADGRRIIGVEALVRWHHPEHGVIPPLQFIGLAEERGLIVPLGAWVLRRACLDALTWGQLTVAVNVSASQFRQKDFVAAVQRVLDETGIQPNRVELELTEGVIIDDADSAEDAMINLRAMGLKLALDDFGTGYSSLIYLRRFAFDKIKIDKSFLEAMEMTGESAILVHSVVHLGRALGLVVTAEGVETPEQHRFLQAVGCHLLQGYLFSKPIPAEAITALMQTDGTFLLPAAAAA